MTGKTDTDESITTVLSVVYASLQFKLLRGVCVVSLQAFPAAYNVVVCPNHNRPRLQSVVYRDIPTHRNLVVIFSKKKKFSITSCC